MSVFTKSYWKQALSELKKPKMLILAGLLIALRVALKSVQIPIIPGQMNITFGYFVNAVGAMTFGPVVAIISAAISDTLGAVIAPQGAYFFPYIFQEIAGSLIFALFLYRQRLTVPRTILSRFFVVLVCNIILQPLITMLWNFLNPDASYTVITTLRVVKNLALFPLESLLLVLFIKAMIPVLKSLKFTENVNFKIKPIHIILLIVLTVIMLLSFCVYREITKPGSIGFMSFIHNII